MLFGIFFDPDPSSYLSTSLSLKLLQTLIESHSNSKNILTSNSENWQILLVEIVE